MKLLIEHGANINAKDKMGRTPLYCALERGNDIEMVKFFVENGADVHSTMKRGTLLHTACPYPSSPSREEKYNIIEMIKLLVEYGVNVNMKNEKGDTPLHMVCRCNNYVDATKLFIELGVDPNVKNNEGVRPLHLAAGMNRNFANVKVLIDNGVEVNSKDKL